MNEFDERELIDFVREQRWFGAKAREITHAAVVDAAELPAPERPRTIALVEMRFPEGTHELYQLFLGADPGEELDALADPVLGRELMHGIRGGVTLQAQEGTISFNAMPGFADLGRELTSGRLVASEQSNSSLIFEDELILKVFRRLEAGINPELEMLRFLTAHGFRNIAALSGWYAYVGRPLEATLGIAQAFIRDARDGWDLALDELGDASERFLDRLRRLGEVTGSMHTVLGSDPSDPGFCAEETSAEALGLLTATVDEEIERVFLELPEDNELLAPLVGRGEEVREQLRMLTHVGTVGRVIRHHGDFHLGQTLWADGDWWVIDFEGEPARPLAERRRKRSPLRDVAGMLRSFAYASTAAEILRGVVPPAGWEERAREEFLAGYLDTVDSSLVPSGRQAIDRLIAIFELEKAVYELRYELNNRPDWARIPVAGILRLMEQPLAA